MKPVELAAAILLTVVCATTLSAQAGTIADLPVAAPNLLLLVHQEVSSDRARQREKLEESMSRRCDRLETPSFWINLQSLSNPRKSLFFDPFDSFEQLEQSRVSWRRFYASHPDLSRLQEEIDELVGDEHTTFAIRRQELGYLTDTIDLSKTRFVRTVEVHLFPGRENDFIETLKILADSRVKIQANVPWEVYEVNAGMASPTFFILMPLVTLAKNDDLLYWEQSMANEESAGDAQRMKEIAHDSYASAETTLYEVRPEMSHVSKEFADSDPVFWRHTTASGAKPEEHLYVKPPKKGASDRRPSQ